MDEQRLDKAKADGSNPFSTTTVKYGFNPIDHPNNAGIVYRYYHGLPNRGREFESLYLLQIY